MTYITNMWHLLSPLSHTMSELLLGLIKHDIYNKDCVMSVTKVIISHKGSSVIDYLLTK